MKTDYTEVPLSKVLDWFVKDYQGNVARYEAFIDTQKQVVVFKLFLDESQLTSAPASTRE